MAAQIQLMFVFVCVALLITSSHSARIRRIVGGEQLAVGAWPWLVSLNYKEHHVYLELQGLKHLCGGTLVDESWVLTAAHCVHFASGSHGLGEPNNWIAVLGEYNRRIAEEMEQNIELEAIFVHPNYTLFPNLSGDIALLKLKTPAQITPAVRPVALDNVRDIPTGMQCKAAGWGQHTADSGDDWGEPQYGNGTMVPHVIDVKRVSQEGCSAAYNELWPLIDNRVICFNSNHRKDTCKGDSGGPLICQGTGGSPVVTGVVSVGMGCALEDYPGIYTRVSSYRDWIVNTIRRGGQEDVGAALDNLIL